MINYSIVIPHKNTPDLLQYCLDSIPVRDDVQVIVVDDNSDADKVDFEHFPHWKGENYEYYLTKKSGGTGFAENVGIGQAKGRWVIFVGADDYLLPSANAVFDEEKDTEADMVFFRPTAVLLDDRSSFSKRADQYNAIIDRYFVSGDETELRCRYFSICGRLIRREMIMEKDIRFDEIRYSNDNLFAVKIGVGAGKIEVRDKELYCITDEKLSIYYLRLLFSENRKAFVLNFKRMRKMGYKKSWLIHEVFRENSRKARVKRSVYAFLATGIK